MAVSYVSSVVKSNPYVLPLDLNLMTKVLTFKDAQFKTNAAKIQSNIDALGSVDLLKSEDKEYMNGKVNAVVEDINSLGGVDLGDVNVINRINSISDSVYSDNDLVTAISSTQTVRSLMDQYQKMQSNPKLSSGFAPQNYEHDMKYVTEWQSNGRRTTQGDGYKGPSTPTPFFDLDKFAVDAAKEVKSQYTQSSTKDGIYIHNDTKEEVTAEAIKARVNEKISANPNAMQQASINAEYLHKGYSADDVYKMYHERLSASVAKSKEALDNFTKIYDAASGQDKIALSESKKAYEASFNNINSELKKLESRGVKHVNDYLPSYKTSIYLDDMTYSLSNAMGYKKETSEIKPDLAAQAFLRNQIEAEKVGLQIARDPTSRSGYSVVGARKTSILEQGTDIYNSNRDKKEPWTTERVTNTILTKQAEKQQLFQEFIKDDLALNGISLGVSNNNAAQVAITDFVKGENDPNFMEIEDIQNVKSSYLTKDQADHISQIWTAFQQVQRGETPSMRLTQEQLSKLMAINNLNKEIDLYTTLRNKATGSGTLTGEEAAEYNLVASGRKSKSKPGELYAKVNGGIFDPISVPKDAPSLDVVLIKRDGKSFYVPSDGKDHKYKNVSIPSGGVEVNDAFSFNVPGGALIKDKEVDKNYLYKLNIFSTKAQQVQDRISKKISSSGIAPDPKAYDALNFVSNYINKTFPQDLKEQSGSGRLNSLKYAIVEEARTKTGNVTFENGTAIADNLVLSKVDMQKSYVTRIGTSSEDPFKIEATVALVGERIHGTHNISYIKKVLTESDLKSLDIDLPPREFLIEKASIDVTGRSPQQVYKPSNPVRGTQLLVPMSVVKTGSSVGNEVYTPVIELPINGKIEQYPFNSASDPGLNLSADNPYKARVLFQNMLDALNSEGVLTTEDFFNLLKNR